MVKKISIILTAIIITQFISYIPVSAVVADIDIDAQCALLVEKDSGIILFEQDIHKRHPADNLTKIMTILIASQAVENDIISDNEIIVMTEDAWFDIGENSTTQNIEPGLQMTFIDLLYSAFVGNANEACNMIALRLEGSINNFVRKMNEKAAELGLSDTSFTNAHGQYDINQYTTAYDMYVLYREALKCNLFNEIVSTYRHLTEWFDDTPSRTLLNPNALMNQSSIYYYRYCLSGLSSSSYEGGQSLIATAQEDGLTLISVVLGAREVINDDDSVNLKHFSETNRLFTWGYTNYAWQDILKTTDLLARVPVAHGAGADSINVRPERPLTLLLPVSVTTESFDFTINIFSEKNNEPLIAPVSAGDILGEVIVSKDGVVYDTIELIANTDIELNALEYMRRRLIAIIKTPIFRNIVIGLVVLILIYVALIIRYNVNRINRIRRIRNARSDILRNRRDNNND